MITLGRYHASMMAALRFFYIQVLKRSWSVAETPYPKQMRLPQVLSQQEVARLIEVARYQLRCNLTECTDFSR